MSASESNSALRIRTAEGIAFSLPVAGPVTRFLAWVIDLACVITIIVAFNMVAGLFTVMGFLLAGAVQILVFFIVWVGYAIVLEWVWRGQTLGKRLLGLRVMDERGLRLHFNQIVLRNLLRVVDSLPMFYLLGGVVSIFTQHHQRLGDIAAGTVVTRRRTRELPDVERILGGKYNSFRAYPHLQARLRQNTPPEAGQLALQALHRRDEFKPEARLRVFRELRRYFEAIVAFPEESIAGLTDEQYARNVVDSLFNTHASAFAHTKTERESELGLESPTVRVR